MVTAACDSWAVCHVRTLQMTYERSAIEAHIRRARAGGEVPRSPVTGAPLGEEPLVVPNDALQRAILSWRTHWGRG